EYIYTKHINSPIANNNIGSEQDDTTRQTRSKISILRFKKQCLFCEQSAVGIDALSNDISVFTGSEQLQNIKEVAKKRKNEHDLRLLHHLSNEYDLTAVDARYHRSCLKSFYANCDQNSTQAATCGRPTEKDKNIYFQQLCIYLEENKECQYYILDLYNKMKSFANDGNDVYSNSYLLKKLKDHFKDRIVISQNDGRETIICLKNAAQKVLRQMWTAESDPRIKRIQKVEEAATIILEDILMHMQDIVMTPSVLTVNANVDTKIITIAHAIISAVRPRSFLSQLHVSLAIWLHMKFASRVLVDMISSLGLCASYAEVQRFELSTTKCPQTTIDSNAFFYSLQLTMLTSTNRR
ncbi:hypothetical protein B566_EDAN016862, partial [Ephemera danica]